VRRRLLVLVVPALVMLGAACIPPQPAAPPVTSSVSCAGTPVAPAIQYAFAGTGEEDKALRIAARESGCNPCAFYPSRSDCSAQPTTAKGLFQLLGHDDLIQAACPYTYPLPWSDPDCNAGAARLLYDAAHGWGPWGG
jgi:hypothetical protein